MIVVTIVYVNPLFAMCGKLSHFLLLYLGLCHVNMCDYTCYTEAQA